MPLTETEFQQHVEKIWDDATWRKKAKSKGLYKIIKKFFSGNKDKTEHWFKTPNPMLGYVSPAEMILNGKIKKLKKIIAAHQDLEQKHNG